ncbi:hypothetical protein AB0M36_08855 [Actinoplanes sp. NPDC051346]|uniref:hypothetical protein n=1 Tax=Actinoplanes sp. NPDC051346 TaxID=3155048 RepID=UPI00343B59EE
MNNAYFVVENAQIACVNDPRQAVTQVVVRGQWNDPLRHEISRVLRACLMETCQALIIDVEQLEDAAGSSASTWETAARFAAEGLSPATRGTALYMAVQDRRRRLPQVIYTGGWPPGELLAHRGMGLRLVAATAAAWGALPCREGKTVWAILATQPARGPWP